MYGIINYLVRKKDDNISQFTFQREEGCVIKEAVANKERKTLIYLYFGAILR